MNDLIIYLSLIQRIMVWSPCVFLGSSIQQIQQYF